MANAAQKTKLLIVDVSPSMAQVLRTFALQHEYDCDVFSDTALACEALKARFANINDGYDCVMLGWPEGKIAIIADLLGSLATPDHSDLPLIVLSQKANNDVQTLSRRRGNTQSLLWKDHEQAAEIIESLVFHEDELPGEESHLQSNPAEPKDVPVAVMPTVQAPARVIRKQEVVVNKGALKQVLLVDYASPVCNALRDLFRANGHHVTVVGTATEARAVVDIIAFDLVVTEFYLRAESGEDLCRYLKEIDAVSRPVYAVMADKNLDSVVQKSLSAGAITCLNKAEPVETLFARLNAIANGVAQNEPMRVANPAVAVPVVTTRVLEPVVVKAEAPAIKPLAGDFSTKATKPKVQAPKVGIFDLNSLERAISAAVGSTSEKIRYNLLMLDIKMVAAATNDRLSVGASAPMLEMVKAKLAGLYTREDSLAYLGDGKFVLLLATENTNQALLLSKKLIDVVPSMISYLSDVELLTHGAFLQLHDQAGQTPHLLLKHCAAACMRTELDKADNRMYVISKDQYLPPIEVKKIEPKRPQLTVKLNRKVAAA